MLAFKVFAYLIDSLTTRGAPRQSLKEKSSPMNARLIFIYGDCATNFEHIIADVHYSFITVVKAGQVVFISLSGHE